MSVTHRVRERTREVNKHPKSVQIQSWALQAPAVCVAQCELAGHLGSVGDDTIENSSKEEDQKEVKAK